MRLGYIKTTKELLGDVDIDHIFYTISFNEIGMYVSEHTTEVVFKGECLAFDDLEEGEKIRHYSFRIGANGVISVYRIP